MSHLRGLFRSAGKPVAMGGFLLAMMALAIVVEAPDVRAESVTGSILCTNCGSDPFAAEGTVTMDDSFGTGNEFAVIIDFTSVAGKLLDVYFESAGWDSIGFVSVTENYVLGATPHEPPAAGSITDFGGVWGGAAQGYTGSPSSSPPTITGSGGGYDEALTFIFSGITDGANFLTFATAVLSDFQNGFRIAMHIGNCTESGESCTAIGAPIPAALWLFVSALLGWVGIGYRRKKTAAATA